MSHSTTYPKLVARDRRLDSYSGPWRTRAMMRRRSPLDRPRPSTNAIATYLPRLALVASPWPRPRRTATRSSPPSSATATSHGRVIGDRALRMMRAAAAAAPDDRAVWRGKPNRSSCPSCAVRRGGAARRRRGRRTTNEPNDLRSREPANGTRADD